jgi:serine/threonine protein kinase
MSVKNEIKTLEDLNHPNIMRLFEVIDQRSQVHLVMELCQGMPLYHHIKKLPSQRFPEQTCKVIFRQLALGLGYMHAKGRSHRDLKLDNVLYEQEQKKIKIIDFGFSIPSSQQKVSNTVCGTPHYMDPDLSRKTAYNPMAADVWALGVCLYIMFVGKLPFFAEFESDLFRRIQTGKFKPVPKELGDSKIRGLLNGIFRIDPKQRFTADDVLRHEWLQYS